MAVTPFVTRLYVDVPKDSDLVDRKNITHWLMAFSAGKSVNLDDFRGSTIRLGGVEFSGSAELIYDQYISDLIQEFEERWIRIVEDALDQQLDDKLDEVARQSAGLIEAYSRKLVHRAEAIKGTLGKRSGATRLRLRHFRQIAIEKRLLARAEEVRRSRNLLMGTTRPWYQFWHHGKGPVAAVITLATLILGLLGLIVALLLGRI